MNYTDKIILSALKDENIHTGIKLLMKTGMLYRCNQYMKAWYNFWKRFLPIQIFFFKIHFIFFLDQFHLPILLHSLYSHQHLLIQLQSLLKRFGTKLREKCSALFKDFLPSGKYFEPTQTLIESSETCPSNNISAE